MSSFVRQSLDKKLNRYNPISRIERLESATGARSSLTVNDLGEIADKISSAKFYAVDVDKNVIRMIMSGESLAPLIGTDAHLAGLADDGTVQFYVDAATGKLYAGAGAVILDTAGIKITAPVFPNGKYIEWFADDTGAPVGKILAWYDTSGGSGLYTIGQQKASTDTGHVGLATMGSAQTIGQYKTLFDMYTDGQTFLDLRSADNDSPGNQGLIIQTKMSSSDTTAVNTSLYLDGYSKGTPGTGFGVAMAYRPANSAGTIATAGYEQMDWTDSTSGSEDAEYKIALLKAGVSTISFTVDPTAGVTAPFGITVGGGAAIAKMDSGVYTPALTNVTNVAASTAAECQWIRVGDMVTVSGRVAIDPTTTATATELGMALPVASNLGATEDLGGVAAAPGLLESVAILGDAANNRASFQFICQTAANHNVHFIFNYQII